jgi:hypothetical protein
MAAKVLEKDASCAGVDLRERLESSRVAAHRPGPTARRSEASQDVLRSPTRRKPQTGEIALRINTLCFAAATLLIPAHAGAQAPAADHSQHHAAAQAGSETTAAANAGTTTGASAATAGADSAASIGPVQVAAKEDIKAGATVIDQKGGSVGTIESVSAEGAVIATGKARVQIPLGSFGKSASGLVIGMTKTELEAAAAKGG